VVQGAKTAIIITSTDPERAFNTAMRYIRMAKGDGDMIFEERNTVTGVFAPYDPMADEDPTPIDDGLTLT
jgi:hypothetical protein